MFPVHQGNLAELPVYKAGLRSELDHAGLEQSAEALVARPCSAGFQPDMPKGRVAVGAARSNQR